MLTKQRTAGSAAPARSKRNQYSDKQFPSEWQSLSASREDLRIGCSSLAPGRHRLLEISVVAFAITLETIAGGAQQPREDIIARLISGPLVVHAPLGSCTVTRVTAAIGRYANIPTGV